VQGVGAVPNIFFGWNPNILLLRSPCKIANPVTTPSGRISNEPGRKRREEERGGGEKYAVGLK
jgi:hypothetical protein